MFEFVTDREQADRQPPLISNCPDAINLVTSSNSAIASWDLPTAIDNSGNAPRRSSNYSPGQSFPLGTTLVRYTFRDDSGNSAICSFEVIVRQQGISPDTIAPIISNCPDAINLLTSTSSAIATWDLPTATDNSGYAPRRSSNYNPGQAFPLGNTLVRYTFSDDSGNSATCSFSVTVRLQGTTADTTAPLISNCPSGELNIQAASGANGAIATWTEPRASDDSGAIPSRSSNHNPGELFPIGSTLVSYIFADASGNQASCSFTVTVRQGGIPSALTIRNCPDDITVSPTSSFTLVEWTAPTATAQTAVSVESNYQQPRVFVGSDRAPFQVVYTFRDEAGNSATCEFTITVLPRKYSVLLIKT